MRIFGPTILIALAMQAAFAHSSQSAAQSSPAIAHPAQPAAAPAKAAAPGAQPASPPQVTSISVRDYGIFSADDQASKKPAADGISFTAVSRLHMTKKTRTIPLRKASTSASSIKPSERLSAKGRSSISSSSIRRLGSANPAQPVPSRAMSTIRRFASESKTASTATASSTIGNLFRAIGHWKF